MQDIRNIPAPSADGTEVRELLLNALHIELYVSDMASDEILYASPSTQQMVGSSMLAGRTCWEVIKKKESRCTDCPVYILLKNPGKCLKRVVEENGKRSLVYDSIIPWQGGKFAHLQYSIDFP